MSRVAAVPASAGIRTIEAWRESNCIRGIWRKVNFGKWAAAPLTQSGFDVPEGKHVWPGTRYARSCRRLSDGECIAHGLPVPTAAD